METVLTCVESVDRFATVGSCYYDEDSIWHLSIHENGGSVSENIADSLKTVASGVMFDVFASDGGLAAFFVLNGPGGLPSVEGFHVRKAYRTAEFLAKFWELIFSKFRDPIHIGLYRRNKDAIAHCKRQGFNEVAEVQAPNGKEVLIMLRLN